MTKGVNYQILTKVLEENMNDSILQQAGRLGKEQGFIPSLVNFDVRDDIRSIIEELSKKGSGYEEAIKAAERNMANDPDKVLEILQGTLEIANLADSFDQQTTN